VKEELSVTRAGMTRVRSPYRLVRPPVPAPVAPALDPSQQAVVDHPGGPLLVLAGPGTGKTTTLVEAVLERVRRGASPDEILVLTFSRKAADELRERIAARLGRTVAEPAAYTFHSWCYALLRAHSMPGSVPRLLSQPERDVRLRELLRGHVEGAGTVAWPADLRPALLTRGFAREIAGLFDRARERGLDGEGLRRLGEQTRRPAWVAAGTFLDEYLNVLDARGEIDYAGLVGAATGLLAQPSIGASVRGRYRAVFVDEYQDTDPAQDRLLKLLAGDGADLVVVGDPDQSIYAFRGAEVANILTFCDRFRTRDGRTADQLTLQVSRRTGPALLAASRAVAAKLPMPETPADVMRAHRDLDAQGPDGQPPRVHIYPTAASEVSGIADLLRRAHLEDQLPWSQMAVLVRSGSRTLPVLRRALVASGVPCTVATDDLPVARDPAVAPLLIALRIAGAGLESMSDDDARVLLSSQLVRFPPSLVRALGRKMRATERMLGAAVPRSSATLLREAVVDPRAVVGYDDLLTGPVRKLHDLLAGARDVVRRGGTPDEALWVLWNDSGWARRLAADAAGTGAVARSANRDLDAVVGLFEAAARLEEREPRAGVATLLDELGMQEVPGAPQEERAGVPEAVRLLTAHRSKGLEWELVVIASVQDDNWPDLRRRSSLLDADLVDVGEPRPAPTVRSLLADERRLFYVAMTRARRRLVVTAVKSSDEASAVPSRFLDDLVETLPATELGGTELLSPGSLVARLRRTLQTTASPALREVAAQRLAALALETDDDGAPLVPAADPSHWWGLLDWSPGLAPVRDPDQPLLLSGSALSGYDNCPLRWFLEREVNARPVSSAAQGFGMVIHTLADLVAQGRLPADADMLVDQLDEVWSALGFEATWQRDREREEARGALRRFVRWLEARDDRRSAGSETDFEVTVGDVILRGAIDRLEIDDDGRVHVVDFKTGRTARSVADVAADPQLAAYQLAVREGGLAETLGEVPTLGGAQLVFLRREMATGLPAVRNQPALPDESVTWAHELVARTGAGVRAEEFPARPNDGCNICAFRGLCPAQDAGDQVVS
jgi:superfamily I DNA/RNA helicase/RecB family exonuclease